MSLMYYLNSFLPFHMSEKFSRFSKELEYQVHSPLPILNSSLPSATRRDGFQIKNVADFF